MIKKRTPYYQRLENPPRFRLKQRDKEVVKLVHECEFMKGEQIGKLLFPSAKDPLQESSRMRNRRLFFLYHHRFLNRILVVERAFQTARNTPAVYVVDQEGKRLLEIEYGIPGREITLYPNPYEVRNKNVQHQFKINDTRIALTLAARARGDEIVGWVSERELRRRDHRVKDPRTNKMRVLVPDGFLIYQRRLNGQMQKYRFFVEVDRATMDTPRFGREKVQRYIYFRKSADYIDWYDDFGYRVLIITKPTRKNQHLNELKKSTERIGGKDMFWFCTFDDLDPKRILTEPIWYKAGSEGKFALLRE